MHRKLMIGALAVLAAPVGLMAQTVPAPASAARTASPLGSPQTWIGLEDYPAAAYQALQEGAVRVRLSIAPLGFVDGCTVVESSGSVDLDEATCRLLSARAFFNPARNDAGQAVAGEYVRRIRWQHPQLHPTPSAAPETVPPPVSAPQ